MKTRKKKSSKRGEEKRGGVVFQGEAEERESHQKDGAFERRKR